MVTTEQAKILVIEDNALNLDMACELLELSGFKTYQANNANTGIKMAREINPDLILMDLHLPYMDGFTATRLIKSEPELNQIPIVAFTALAMKEDQDKAIASGCSGVIPKPIDIEHFAETISGYIHHGADQPVEESRQKQFVPRIAGSGKTGVMEEKESHSARNGNVIPIKEPYDKPEMSSLEPHSHEIVVVDDNPVNVELLKDALENDNHHVVPAYNGQEAIQLIRKNPPDVVLLDIMMPDMDGYQVLEILKKDPKTAEIPVIFISALNQTEDMVRGLNLGSYDYITKPFKVEEVKARIYASLRIKDLQDRLRSERDKLSVIFRFSADAIALLGPDLEVISANPLFGEWFQLSLTPEGRPVKPVHFFDLIPCQCEASTPCPLHTPNISLIPDETTSPEATTEPASKTLLQNATLHDAAGNPRYVNIHCGLVPGLEQYSKGYVVVLRDVTVEKTIERSKENFVATLTHDLKTPIRAEYQALELLYTEALGPLSEDQKEMLKEIIQSNRYMSELVESLLSTYLLEEGKMKLNLVSLDLNALISEQIIQPLATLAHEKNQTLILNLAPNLPHVRVDSIEIQRVIHNLVQNAINFTPEQGTITLSTSYRDSRIVVSVEDTGPGIPEEKIPTIFERYTTNAKQFKKIGTGLGLYLSKKIVEAHGGKIGAESKIGQGSRFYFELPLEDARQDSVVFHN